MPAPRQPCGEGRRRPCHLRRIGCPASVRDDADLIHFHNTVTLVGRNLAAVDAFLSHEYISRIHARVIHTARAYELVDSSLTGVYVNDVRISDKVVLHEGDTVTFGHPCWRSVKPGTRVRQPNSPFYYLFEPCGCDTEPSQGLSGERRPLRQRLPELAPAGASAPVSSSVGFAPELPVDPPGALPRSAHQCLGITSPTLLGASAALFLPPVTASPSINSLNLVSRSSEAPGQPTLSSLPRSAPGDARRPASRLPCSASPGCTVLGEGFPATTESSPQRTLGVTRSPCSQESPASSGSEEPVADDTRSRVSVSAPTGLPGDLLPVRGFSQAGGSELSVSSTEELAPSDSDRNEEMAEVDMDQGPEGAAGPGAQVQVRVEREAAGRMEIQNPGEEHPESFGEKTLPEASVLEPDWAESRASDLAVQNSAQLPARSGEAEWDAASRASDDFSSSGEEPGNDSSAKWSQEEPDSESESSTLLPGRPTWETQRSEDDEISLQEWASDSGDNMETEPRASASQLATNCHAAAGDGGFLEPEMGSVGPEATSGIRCKVCIAKRSYAEVGTQTECAKRRKLGAVMEESLKEEDTIGTGGVLDDGSTLNTDRGTGGLLQASAVGTPAENEHAKGEFSQQVEKDLMASSGATREILSSGDLPETHKEESAGVAVWPSTTSPPTGGAVPEESAETLEHPVDVDAKLFCGVVSERDVSPLEEQGEGIVVVTKQRIERAYAKSDEGPEDSAADSTLEAEGRLSEHDGLPLGTVRTSMSVAGMPRCPRSASDGKMECQEEMNHNDLPEEGKRGGGGIRTAGGKDEANGEGGLEGEPSPIAAQEESLSGTGADGALRSLGGNSSDSSGRKTRECLSAEILGDDLEEGEVSHPGHCADTQASSQASEEEAGRCLEPENGHLLALQGGIDSEDDTDSNDQSAAEAQECGVSVGPSAGVSLDDMEVDSAQNEPRGTSAPLECRQPSPAPDEQQPQPPGTEPEDLEDDFAVKPQGAGAGRELLCPEDAAMEGSVWEEACERNEAVEQAAPEREKETAHAGEEGGGLDLTPESCHCIEEKDSLSLDTPGSGNPAATQGMAPGGAPRETQTDPAEAPESAGGHELSLPLSDSEDEKEENDRGRLQKGRSPVWHSDSVAENNEALRKLPEESPAQGSCDAVMEETSPEPVEGSGVLDTDLEQDNSSHDESRCDLDDAATAAPQAHNPEVAAGEKSPLLPRTAVVGEDLEDQAVEGADLVPVNLACLPVEPPCLTKSDARFGGEDKTPESPEGSTENSGLDLLQDNRLADDKFPGQPRVGDSDVVGETVTENLGCETPTSCSPGEDAGFLKGEVEAPLLLHQEIETLECPGDAGQQEGGPDPSAECGEAVGCSGHPRRLLPEEEEESEGSSSRKRHFSEDEATPDLPPLAMTPPAPLSSEGLPDRFGTAEGKPLNQHDSQVTLSRSENEKAEELPLPREAETAEDEDCQLAEVTEAGRRPTSGEPSSPEEQVSEVQSQDPSRDDRGSTPGPLSGQSGCPPQEQDKDSADHVSESMWDTYFSEEESFQLSLCSGLQNSPSVSPVNSPKAEGAPGEKSRDSSFSDISSSSAESHSREGSPEPPGRDASGAGGDGLPKGVSEQVGKRAKTGVEPDFSSDPETSDMDWFDEDLQTPSHPPGSPWESSPAPRSGTPSALDHPSGVAAGECDASSLQEAGGAFEGDGDKKASSVEESGWAAPCMGPTPGGEEEEAAMEMAGLSQRQPEESALLQRSHGDSPCQDMECDPALDPPSALPSPWGSSGAPDARRDVERSQVPLKTEPPDEEQHCRDGDRNCTSRTTSVAASSCELASCPMVGGVKSKGPPSQTYLAASCSSPTQASSPGEHPLELNRPRSPLPSSEDPGSAGMAENAGEDPAQDLNRSDCGAAWGGQADSNRALTVAPRDPSLATGVSGNQVPACSPSKQNSGATVLGCSTGAPWASWTVKEEKELCDPAERQDGPSCDLAYPTASSPVITVLHKPRPSASKQPKSFASPGDLGNRDRLLLPYRLEEAELTGQLGGEQVCSEDESVACPPPLGSEDAGSASKSRDHPAASGTRSQSDRWPFAAGMQSDVLEDWASSEQDVAFQLQECQSVLGEILGSLESLEGIDQLHMEKWREQIAALQTATQMPRTPIAVVGNTGAGKSCLLNALLDEEAVLPTSAMRACTAVVVEISRADGSSPYEADVEFLSQEEWDKELKSLLEDMKDKSGHLKKRCPDRKTEAGAAYSRVKAVYGRVEELGRLEEMREVTQHLGTVKRICAETATEFRSSIERFIDSRTDNLREMKGGEFWPIVKCVRIRLAKAEVLKTGAVLVDLPGIRDSNAARDSVAKEYLKNCSAVWVVASITRAVDDKTAKEALSASVRRQLLMDGHFGSLAFVCTKSDSFNITDIVRNLDLRGKIQPIEDEVRELDNQKVQAEREKEELYASLPQEPLRRGPGCDASDSGWLQRRHDLLEKEFRISNLQRQKEAKLREISLICVQARNKYSKQQILLGFSTSLEDLARRGASPEGEEDGDEDLEEGDSARPDSGHLGEGESLQRTLQVFTVSSTEYLKLCGKLIRDGQPQVFHDPQDTEIPALRKFAIRTALKHSMVAAEKVIRDLARVLSQIVNYLTSQRAETDIQESVWQALQALPDRLQEPIESSLRDTQHCLQDLLFASLTKGTGKAKELCEDVVRSWGCPVSGYPHATYRAVCNHHGLYTSPTYNRVVDFNSHLAEPIWEALAATWNEVFNCKLKESIQGFAAAILDQLKRFFRDLRKNLRKHSRIVAAIHVVYCQQMEAAQARLLNFTLGLMDYITKRQRSISRLVTPEIRARMEPAYAGE